MNQAEIQQRIREIEVAADGDFHRVWTIALREVLAALERRGMRDREALREMMALLDAPRILDEEIRDAVDEAMDRGREDLFRLRRRIIDLQAEINARLKPGERLDDVLNLI